MATSFYCKKIKVGMQYRLLSWLYRQVKRCYRHVKIEWQVIFRDKWWSRKEKRVGLSHTYSVTVNHLLIDINHKTFEVIASILPLGTLISVHFLFANILIQGNPDIKHKLWYILPNLYAGAAGMLLHVNGEIENVSFIAYFRSQPILSVDFCMK